MYECGVKIEADVCRERTIMSSWPEFAITLAYSGSRKLADMIRLGASVGKCLPFLLEISFDGWW